MAKDWIGHPRPFEYEYRFTDYEYKYEEIWPDAIATR